MEEFNLKEIVDIIKRRKGLLIIFMLLVILGGTLYSFTATPIYEATAKVLVNFEKPIPVNFENNFQEEYNGKEFIETQVALIKSRSLIRDVIKELKLNDAPEFNSTGPLDFLFDAYSWLSAFLINLGIKDELSESLKPDIYSPYIDDVLERLKVTQLKSSRIVEISFQGENPMLVAKITNTLTTGYINKSLELFTSLEGSSAGWIDEKLEELNIKLKNSEKNLQEFKKSKSFIEAKNGRDLVTKKWSGISQELTKVTSERLRLESQIRELEVLRADPLKLLQSQPFLFNSNLSELQKSYINLKSEYSSLLKSKTAQHPDVVSLSQKLDLIKLKIPSEVENFLSSQKINLKAIKSRENILEKTLEDQKNKIIQSDNDSLQFNFLKQEVELNEKLYNEISNRKKELEVTSNFNSSNIRIVDQAEVPYLPVKPNKGRNFILSAFIGLFGGFFLIFFQESQDKTITREEDIEGSLPYFYWGSIANLPKYKHSFPITNAEIFRGLKTQFLLKTKNSSQNIFLITSPNPGEGKTFIASQLALSLGNSGKSVLIIDCDFFNPKISSILESAEKPGFLDNLGDVDKITHSTLHKNVWVTPPGGAELKTKLLPDVFLSDSFQSFINEARRKWDYIFIKAPPVLATPDAKVLEKLCHGTILVLQSGSHDPTNVQKVFNQLTSDPIKQNWGFPFINGKDNDDAPNVAKTKLFGIVINKIDPKYKQVEYQYYQNF